MHATNTPRPPAPPACSVSTPDSLAFDRWLQDRLGRLYGAVLQEPVPEALRAVLEQQAK